MCAAHAPLERVRMVFADPYSNQHWPSCMAASRDSMLPVLLACP